MDVKHTPGEWWASDLEVGTAPMMFIKVARVSGADYEEAKANARLIAAAPDLLKALQAVVSVADRATDEFDLARAAIAKALGD